MDINTIKKVVKWFFDFLQGKNIVYLLGSALTGNLRPDSDIDLGIMLEQGVRFSSIRKAELTGILSFELGRNVDIGEVSGRSLVYSREALLKGLPLYQRDRDKSDLYRANILGLYTQFNIDRREVLNAYGIG